MRLLVLAICAVIATGGSPSTRIATGDRTLDARGIVMFDLARSSDTGTKGDQITKARRVTLIGLTIPLGIVSLRERNLSAVADSHGRFTLEDVILTRGVNNLTITTTSAVDTVIEATQRIERIDSGSSASSLIEWNEFALDAIRATSTPPPVAARVLALQSLAVFDAVNAAQGRPSHLVRAPATEGTSPEAAAAVAAYRVLVHIYPAQRGVLNDHLQNSLNEIPDTQGKAAGITLGQTIADLMIASRDQDGWDVAIAYQHGNEVGRWRPTEPKFVEALLPHWARLRPFVLTSPSQLRPPGPPALESDAYAAAVNEVKTLGATNDSSRTAEQTEIALFWADGAGTYTPPGHWNQIAGDIASAESVSLFEAARLFAILNCGLLDAAIAAWDAKYRYELWRPIDAIWHADQDANAATIPDPAWVPLLITPPFPEYVSGHAAFSGAAASILSRLFGESVVFDVISDGLPNVTRRFSSFHEAAEEAGRSRVYGGIHFEFSNRDGLALGYAVGDMTLQAFLDR